MEFVDKITSRFKDSKVKVFYDVGAERAPYSSMAVKRMSENSVVHLFEPRICPLMDIHYNSIIEIGAKKSIQVLVHNIALSDSKGKALIRKDTLSDKVPHKAKLYKPIEIKLDTLDNVVLSTGDYPDIIKIDVEGWECNVLSGAKQIIAKAKTEFFIEVHWQYLKHEGKSVEDVLAFFDDNLYETELIKFLHGKPLEPIRGTKHRKTALSYYYFCPRDIKK